MNTQRPKLFLNRLKKPRQVRYLFWPESQTLGEFNVTSHRCAPGLAMPVQRYVLGCDFAPPERLKVELRLPSRTLHVDPGHMLMADSAMVMVGLDAGETPYYLSCFFDTLHNVVQMLEEAEKKVYDGTETVRLWSFPGVVCVLREAERDQALVLLRPLVDKSFQEAVVFRQQLKTEIGGEFLHIENLPPLPAAAEA